MESAMFVACCDFGIHNDMDHDLKSNARRAFDEFDLDGNGYLSVTETSMALERARLPADREAVEAMRRTMFGSDLILALDEADSSIAPDIDFDTFYNFYLVRRQMLADQFNAMLLKMATACCEGMSRAERRCITLSMLQRAAGTALVPASDSAVVRMFDHLDLNHDGQITFDEWIEALLLVPHFEADCFVETLTAHTFVDTPMLSAREAPPVTSHVSDDSRYLFVKKVVCGGVSGVVSRVCTAPADRIRIMMMAHEPKLSLREAVHLIQNDGRVAGFWVGCATSCIKIVPEMVRMQAFESLNRRLLQPDAGRGGAPTSIQSRLLAGGAAGFFSESVSYPFNVVQNCVAAAPRGTYPSLRHAAASVVAQRGFVGLYAGYTPTVLGIIPFSAIDLSVNTSLRERLAAYMAERNQKTNYTLLFACGMASSTVATLFTFPLYVVRTKVAVSGRKMRDVTRELAREGIRGFYRGVLPSLLKIAPASAIGYGTYDLLNRHL